MRLTQFMSLAEDYSCRVEVDENGEISLVAQYGAPEPSSDLTMVVLPLTLRDTRHLTMWLNMAVNAAEETST
jgi:hypothetical protein